MSHWTKIKTKLSNKEVLKKALTRLGYEYQEGDFKVSQYGTTEKAELLLDPALGLSCQEDGTYAFVGDPYHGRNQKVRQHYGKLNKFTNEVSTAYAVEETIEQLEQHQFFCTENAEAKASEDGLIHMTFESYA